MRLECWSRRTNYSRALCQTAPPVSEHCPNHSGADEGYRSNIRVRDLRGGKVTRRKANVLLVEARDDVRQALGGRLRGLGDFDVVADTSSQARALDLAARLSPELILVDFATTAPYAAELCARIRQASPCSLIVVLTSFADAETRSRYEQAGATACLLKDIGFGRLVDELRALLSDHSRPGA